MRRSITFLILSALLISFAVTGSSSAVPSVGTQTALTPGLPCGPITGCVAPTSSCTVQSAGATKSCRTTTFTFYKYVARVIPIGSIAYSIDHCHIFQGCTRLRSGIAARATTINAQGNSFCVNGCYGVLTLYGAGAGILQPKR